MRKKKITISLLILIPIIMVCGYIAFEKFSPRVMEEIKDEVKRPFTEDLVVPDEYSKVDKNNNGIPDPIDLSNSVEEQLSNKLKYVDAYYSGGYPPENEGVCTDVIWRALKTIDVDLKELMDKDIVNSKKDYWRIEGKADRNIDFRRVPNQMVYFDKYCEKLSAEVIPGDPENLKNWQPGDIILYLKPYQHVGIVTAERDYDGVPYVIHSMRPEITKGKLSWFTDYEIVHYRWKY